MSRGRAAAGERAAVVLDAGLQPERTSLAWTRTVLTLMVGAVVSLRVLPPALGGWGVALAVGGTAAGLGIAVAARRRGERVRSALGAGLPVPPGGALLAAVAAVVALGALAGLAAVVALVAQRP